MIPIFIFSKIIKKQQTIPIRLILPTGYTFIHYFFSFTTCNFYFYYQSKQICRNISRIEQLFHAKFFKSGIMSILPQITNHVWLVRCKLFFCKVARWHNAVISCFQLVYIFLLRQFIIFSRIACWASQHKIPQLVFFHKAPRYKVIYMHSSGKFFATIKAGVFFKFFVKYIAIHI